MTLFDGRAEGVTSVSARPALGNIRATARQIPMSQWQCPTEYSSTMGSEGGTRDKKYEPKVLSI